MDQWESFLNKPLSDVFDEEMWNEIIDETAKCGMNAIVLDAGNGIRFKSHPEVTYYNEDKYKEMGIRFVEEDPYLVNYRLKSLAMMEHGYKYVPCASVFNRCDYNTEDIMAYYKKYANDDQILGYITAPWVTTFPTAGSKQYYEESFRFFKEAKEKIYS